MGKRVTGIGAEELKGQKEDIRMVFFHEDFYL